MRIPFLPTDTNSEYLPLNMLFSQNEISGQNALIGRPCLLEYVDLNTQHPVKAMVPLEIGLLAICGRFLYLVDNLKNISTVGELESSNGPAWMETNGNQIQIICDEVMYVFDGELSKVNVGFRPDTLTYEGGFFISNNRGGQWFYESNAMDGSDYNELDYAITSVSPDCIKCVHAANGNVFAIGSNSGEIYYNSGGSSFSFSKVPGGNIPLGTLAPKSVATFIGQVYLLANDRTVVQYGPSPTKISNPVVDRIINDIDIIDDAVGFTFSINGHSFYVLNFKSGDKTLAYDFTTNLWSEWSTVRSRWRGNCSVMLNGRPYIGDINNGKIYTIDDSVYYDDDLMVIKQYKFPVNTGNNLLTFAALELEAETGTGVATGQGADPLIGLRYSPDKWKTRYDAGWVTYGKAGHYEARPVWRRLGRHRNFTAELTITDPIKVVWEGVSINWTQAGNNLSKKSTCQNKLPTS